MKSKSIILALCAFALISCDVLQNVQDNIAIVSNRNPDGTFKSPVSPKDGQGVDSSATLYRFKGGDFGVTLWTDGSVAGSAPKLARPK